MNLKNKERFFVKTIRELCTDLNIECEFLSQDWIGQLKKDGKSCLTYGYNFSLNNSATIEIARDKVATHMILKKTGIPSVPHHLVLAPSFINQISQQEGSFLTSLDITKELNFPIVCKDNKGAGGNSVFLAKNQIDLESYLIKIWRTQGGAALSPFLEIDKEFRCYILDKKVHILYSKKIATVTGDGNHSIIKLLINKYSESELSDILQKNQKNIRWDDVPQSGEIVKLGWKHNLSKSGICEILDIDSYPEITELSLKAVEALGLRLASVDVVSVNGELMVLEINTGIMMEKFSQYSEKHTEIAQDFFKKILETSFQKD